MVNGRAWAVVGTIAFASAEDAQDFQSLPGLPELAAIEARGERVILAGSGTAPDFLLEAGRAFLAAAKAP